MSKEDEYISTFKINNPEVNKGMDKIWKLCRRGFLGILFFDKLKPTKENLIWI